MRDMYINTMEDKYVKLRKVRYIVIMIITMCIEEWDKLNVSGSIGYIGILIDHTKTDPTLTSYFT